MTRRAAKRDVAIASILSCAPGIGIVTGYAASRVLSMAPLGWPAWISVWFWLASLAGFGSAWLVRIRRASAEVAGKAASRALIAVAVVGVINCLFGVAFALVPYLLRGMD